MSANRFSNILGDDYNIFSKSISHYASFQKKVGKIIKNYTRSINANSIIVIEGGTGTGISTAQILNADKRIKVIGIENEEKTIKQARNILKEYKKRVNLKKNDLLKELKLIKSKSVNIFVSVLTIHNLNPKYRTQLFLEIARILKSGGLFINGDKYARDDYYLHKKDLRDRLKYFDVLNTLGRPDFKKSWTKHYKEDEKIKITENEQIKILLKLGFNNINIKHRKEMEAIITAIR
jgi:tRNA (cmo5U34)-methyltransferase